MAVRRGEGGRRTDTADFHLFTDTRFTIQDPCSRSAPLQFTAISPIGAVGQIESGESPPSNGSSFKTNQADC